MQLHLEACKNGMDEAVFKDQLHQMLHLTDENMLERSKMLPVYNFIGCICY